jgi:hypothetical protein
MRILSSPDEARNALQRDCFFSQGCSLFPRCIRFPRKSAGRGSIKASIIAYLDWQTRFIKILAFKTAKVARISELI